MLFEDTDGKRLIWAELSGDTPEVVRSLDIDGVSGYFPAILPPDGLYGRCEMDADGAIWVTGHAPQFSGLVRIKDEVEVIPFPEGMKSECGVCIDRSGNKIVIFMDGRIGAYADAGPASQRLTLHAYLDGEDEQELVVEAEVVNWALAPAWMNAYFAAEYDGQLYYAPHWSPDPSAFEPHWVKAGSGTRQSGEILRIPVSQLPPGHYKFYGGITFRDRPLDELIGSPAEKIAIAEIDVP